MASDRSVPAASSPDALRRMQRQRRQDTGPELALRCALHAAGFRYRLHRPIAGCGRRRPDLIFPRARVAVFVDGCFWHRCPQHGTTPRNNREWWEHKLAANVARDRDTDQRLQNAGWQVVRVWEHEDTADAVSRVAAAVRRRR